MQNYNKFDNVFLDITEEFKKQNELLASYPKKAKNKVFFLDFFPPLWGIFLSLLYKAGILQKMFYSSICLGWFNEFKKFWVGYLGNRPIDVIDFHFLRNVYRAKFQEVSLDHTDEKNAEKFLASWQLQGNIFYLFHSVWNYSKKAYLNCWLFIKYIKKNGHVLEYGCAVAPITQGLVRYFGYKNLKLTIADIPQVSFLYARWKLMNNASVDSIVIDPSLKDNLPPGAKYDSIVCSTVFEHLPNPLEVANSFFNHLNPGGFLIFDYIKGDGKGLDTLNGALQRREVLAFIKQNFQLVSGEIDLEKSIDLTVVQKAK